MRPTLQKSLLNLRVFNVSHMIRKASLFCVGTKSGTTARVSAMSGYATASIDYACGGPFS